MQQSVPIQQQADLVRVNAFVRSVYLWMTLGLAITGATAWFVASNPILIGFLFKAVPGGAVKPTFIFYVLMFSPIILAVSISARIQKMQASTATALFLLYATLMGAFLSVIFLAYSQSSIANVFFICSGTFLSCSIYGWTTKRDLTSIGSFMMMGFFGILIASVANIFFRSPATYMIISYIGVIVFVGLTAWDTQKLKSMALAQPANLDADVLRKGTIMGALTLYLDFINLFIMLLRIFGRRD